MNEYEQTYTCMRAHLQNHFLNPRRNRKNYLSNINNKVTFKRNNIDMHLEFE